MSPNEPELRASSGLTTAAIRDLPEGMEPSVPDQQQLRDKWPPVKGDGHSFDDELRTNAYMRALLESTQIAALFLDPDMKIRSFTRAVEPVLELAASDRGRPITDILHRLANADLHRDIRQVMEERRPLERTVKLRHQKAFHLVRILPYRTAADEIDCALITFVDITAVVVAEEKQRLLVKELNHRVRNMLQIVMGVANQTLHRSKDLHQFERAYFGRMQALASAYELLSRDGWHDVPLADLIRTQLSAFATDGKRYSTSGPNIVLNANAALSLGLIVYELATNATKYGALSVPTGHVRIDWRLEESDERPNEILHLEWSEQGGPPVSPPSRQGFGSELVSRQLKYELRGEASMEYPQAGLIARLRIRAEDALERAESHGDA